MSRVKVASEPEQIEPTEALVKATDRLGAELRPTVREEKWIAPLTLDRIDARPELHLDDLSEIALVGDQTSDWYYQDRARLRAADGDLVVCSRPVSGQYEVYCRDYLGLGQVDWLATGVTGERGDYLATQCWLDPQIRQQLLERVRAGRLEVIHPHMGIKPVWALAHSLSRETGKQVNVLAPPPELCRLVNHKGWFAEVVKRLLGPDWVPPLKAAGNFTALAKRVAETAGESRLVAVKLPNSAGGEGNVVIEAQPLRKMRLSALRKLLRERLAHLRWDGRDVLLVGPWLDDVTGTPSVQTWVPPTTQGEPVVEGVFDQLVAGQRGGFVGSVPSSLEQDLKHTIATHAWLLARLFQRLGYVGRCSFDLIVTSDRHGKSKLQFIECNGRWGGTSGPMTLMSRVLGNWRNRPYASFEYAKTGLKHLGLQELITRFAPMLHDTRTGQGWLLIYNPSYKARQGGVRYITLGDTRDQAVQLARQEVPALLEQMAVEESSKTSSEG